MLLRRPLHRDIPRRRNSPRFVSYPPPSLLYSSQSNSKTKMKFLLTCVHNLQCTGLECYPAGRLNEPASPPAGLSASLAQAGFQLSRLKTGTPARLRKDSINWEVMERQDGDERPIGFSYLTDRVDNEVRISSTWLGVF